MPKNKSPSKPAAASPEVQTKINEIRAEAQSLFLKKEYSKAADSYASAAALASEADVKAELLQKKVGCLMNLKKYKEAAKEASNVLQLVPSSSGALKSRAKANEQLGLYKQALADAQAVNKTSAATTETVEMEKRLKEAVAGRATTRPQTAPATRGANNPYQVTIKATLGAESKLIYAGIAISYAELLEQVRAKFPNAGPVVLKYLDKDGDLVTIQSRQDIQIALTELIAAFHRSVQGHGQNAAKMLQQTGLPALRLTVQPVPSEADVPVPPAAELQELRQAAVSGAPATAAPAPEVDEWILNFARLFSEVTGLEPAVHFGHHQQGNDKLQRAMVETVQSEGAEQLLDEAADHYRDGVVMSYIQWGNVHITKADRLLQALLKSCKKEDGSVAWPDAAGSAEIKAVLDQYDATEQKIRQALAVHPESWEAIGSLAQLEWERAKCKLGYVLPVPNPEDISSKTPEEQAAMVSKQLQDLLATITKDRVASVAAHITKCDSLFEEALGLAQKQFDAKQAKDKSGDAAKADGNAEVYPLTSPPSHVMIMHGNTMYDWSQVLAVTGAEPWKPVLDRAAAKFRASGAAEPDVRTALKNHLKKDELDLGPDPEPVAPAAPAPAAEEKKTEVKEAKGLPSLKKAAKK